MFPKKDEATLAPDELSEILQLLTRQAVCNGFEGKNGFLTADCGGFLQDGAT